MNWIDQVEVEVVKGRVKASNSLVISFLPYIQFCSQDDVVLCLEAIFDGWKPGLGGSEAKELVACMSWVGRCAALKLVSKIASEEDSPIENNVFNLVFAWLPHRPSYCMASYLLDSILIAAWLVAFFILDSCV